MRRRSFRKLKSAGEARLHHNVYVVLLDEAARKMAPRAARKRAALEDKPCVYVGMTGLTVEERFENHKNGVKAARVTKVHGIELLPELFEHLNPMPYEAAMIMEEELAEDLRAEGYCVFGGH
ncbi:MAG: hypothetical protein ACKVJX_23735 [Verrucomicrobiia bacterium]|jgi:predicted GIY-YIG superfamily endonuclease